MSDSNLEREFSELEIGDSFDYRGTAYSKIAEDKAAPLGGDVKATVHLFYPQDTVTLRKEDSPSDDAV